MQKYINYVKKIIPPLSYDFYKGLAGRVCVIGGCKLYTGAPYYAGISCLKTGCDLSFVICSSHASIMKSYSPELIIFPILYEDTKIENKEKLIKDLSQILYRIHVVVIGPGLGRDEVMFEQVKMIIDIAKKRNLNIVFDGDGLFLISENPELVKGYDRCILTPNPVEYQRLRKAICGNEKYENEDDEIMDMSRRFGYPIIVKKGFIDVICNGHEVLRCESISKASPRRCGGQGDILAGSMGTFLWWSELATRNKNFPFKLKKDEEKNVLERHNRLLGAFGSCLLTKESASDCFIKLKRGMTTPDIINQIPETFERIFPATFDDEDDEK